MNYTETKNKALYFRLIGNIIFMVCVVAVAVSALKGLYFHFDSEPLLVGISKLTKIFVIYIYEHTQFLSFFWKFSPTVNMMNPFEISNIWFALIYFPMFIGASLVRHGRKLASIIRRVDEYLLEEQLMGKMRSRHEIKTMMIPDSSFFSSQFFTLFVAPIIVGVLLIIIQKLLT